MTTIEITVEGMTCGGCENAVRNVLGRLPGIEGVTADHASGKVVISSAAPVDLDAARQVIDDAGFTVV